MGYKKLDVVCPCCETKLTVDQKTGEVIWEAKKEKPAASLSDMMKSLDSQRKEQENIFKQRSASEKDRHRLLQDKFREAQKNVDKNSTLPLRDIDFD
jgi:uncharacterized Zn finger protein (UPF0148 family)